jgi:hypothetical protein
LVSVPFADHCEPLADSSEDLDALLASLKRQALAENRQYVEIRPLLRDAVEGPAEFWKSGVFYNHRLDLSPPLQVLFGRFHRSCVQRKIRRAEREGLAYEAGRSDALLRQFYQLRLLTCRRRHLPPQPIGWFRQLIDCLGDGVAIHVASCHGRPIAAILTLSFKRTVVYKYGGSDARFNRLGGTQLLLWKFLQEAKQRGFDELDLGRSDLHTPGLVTFKDRWGATRSVISYWRWSTSAPHGPGAPRTLPLVKELFARIPDSVLIAAGNKLYRHMG